MHDLMAWVAVGVSIVSLGAAPPVEAARWDEPGPHDVAIVMDTWHDAARDRDVPVKLYLPEEAGAVDPGPLVLFSHGLGGSRDAATYLGEHWASHGYVVVAMQHAGSDTALWRDVPPHERMQALRRATRSAGPALARMGDVRFVLDEVERRQAEGHGVLAGRVDLDRVAMSGHSFGAWTTLAVGGQAFVRRNGSTVRRVEPRIDALLPLSPPAPKAGVDPAVTYGRITLPILMMTGSLDDSPLTGATAAGRAKVFEHLNGAVGGGAAYMLFLEGGDHAVLGGSTRWRQGGGADGDPDLDPLFHRAIRGAATAFLDAHLRADPGAEAWLGRGGVEAIGDGRVVLRQK